MSSPLPSRLLRSAERAALPASLAGLLLLVAAAQLMLPATPPLPAIDVPRARAIGLTGGLPAVRPVLSPPVILDRPIFAPRAHGGANGPSAAGFVLAGTALSHGAALAVVRDAGGTRLLRVGDSIDGYRLVGLGRSAALFAGTDGRHVLRVGASLGAAPAAGASAPAEEGE